MVVRPGVLIIFLLHYIIQKASLMISMITGKFSRLFIAPITDGCTRGLCGKNKEDKYGLQANSR